VNQPSDTTRLSRLSFELSTDAVRALNTVSTATLTSQLLLRGFRSTFLAGLTPQRPELRMVGYAFTLRYVPSREDIGFHVNYDNDTDLQRRAVELVGPMDILVIDARNEMRSASFGHIIATRIWKRGAAGLVTDGALRDRPAFASLDMPSYCRGSHATTSSVSHLAVDMNVPIACSGVLVMPGDILVGDAEGVVVIPAELGEAIAADALEQESVEEFALEQVRAGSVIRDVYPLSEQLRPKYEEWRAARAISH
jgi:regulator of RNase E activity RraA